MKVTLQSRLGQISPAGYALVKNMEDANPDDLSTVVWNIASNGQMERANKQYGRVVKGGWTKLLGKVSRDDLGRQYFGGKAQGILVPRLLPGTDHGELRRDSDGVYSYLSHPYHLNLSYLRDMIEAAQLYGLDLYISGGSHHAPCATVCVVWSRNETARIHKPDFFNWLKANPQERAKYKGGW